MYLGIGVGGVYPFQSYPIQYGRNGGGNAAHAKQKKVSTLRARTSVSLSSVVIVVFVCVLSVWSRYTQQSTDPERTPDSTRRPGTARSRQATTARRAQRPRTRS